MLRVAAIATVVVMLVGCVGTDADPVRNQLADARSNWERAGIDTYTVELEQLDHRYAGCRWITEVVDGEVTSSSAVEPDGADMPCVPWLVSVPELHRAVEIRVNELVESVGTMEVEWNGSGVPESIVYDLELETGEELDVVITFSPA